MVIPIGMPNKIENSLDQRYNVLLALDERPEANHNDRAEMTRLFKAGLALATSQKAYSFTLLGLVQIPQGQSLSEGALPAQTQRALLDDIIAATANLTELPLEIKSVVRVCAANTLGQELNDVILDGQIDLLLLGSHWFEGDISVNSDRFPLEDILRRPLCDLALIGPNVNIETSRDILVAARGGPFAELALRLATNLADKNDGQITLLHVSRYLQEDEESYFEEEFEESAYASLGRDSRSRNRIKRKQVTSQNVQEAIVQEAQRHDLILLGATANLPARAETILQNPFGPVARAVIAQAETQLQTVEHPGVIVVRAGAPKDFYFARLQRRKQQHQAQIGSEDYISNVVDKWFAENTFDAKEFEDVERLVALKKAQGITISLGLPALNEEETVGEIISTLKAAFFDRYRLLDEIVLIDSNSTDRTREIAKELGIPVYIHQEILSSQGSRRGKGEALWKSLYALKGDIIAWLDTDVTNMHPRFLYGLVGPLLKEPRLQYVKGYYRRPLQVGDKTHETGGGRVTELTVRPLFNLFFPELSGLIQPLSGEYAGRRSCLEQLPFFTGYGVETGHLIDLLERFGLQAISQVNLSERRHRNQELGALSQMAFAITQVIVNRLEEREKLHLTDEMNRSMKLINLSPEGLRLEVRHIEDRERPPMLEVPEYRQLHRNRLVHLVR